MGEEGVPGEKGVSGAAGLNLLQDAEGGTLEARGPQ